MQHPIAATTAALAAALLCAGALAQTRGEADDEEQCARPPAKGTKAERDAVRQRCIEEARAKAKSDVPGMANEPGTTATRKPREARKSDTQKAAGTTQ